MRTVYVVEGASGEYSDRCIRPIRAYFDEAKAKAEVLRLEEAFRVFKLAVDAEDNWERQYEMEREHGESVGDPGFQHDYTGTRYYIVEVPLVED